MKKLILGFTVCWPLACGSAVAADMPLKAPVMQAPVPAFSWTGCYLGGFVGLTADGGRSRAYDFPPNGELPLALGNFPLEYNANANGGGLLGCNYEFASGFVIGIESEGGYLHNTATQLETPNQVQVLGFGPPTFVTPYGENYFSRVGDWYALAAGRIGWANDRVLFYAKGGWVWSQVDSSIGVAFSRDLFSVAISGSSNVSGFAVGGGMEWAFHGNWILRGEALYMGFQKSYTICGPTVTQFGTNSTCTAENLGSLVTAKLALEYKFDWPGAPVVAKY